MATICVGCGLTVDPDGKLKVDSPHVSQGMSTLAIFTIDGLIPTGAEYPAPIGEMTVENPSDCLQMQVLYNVTGAVDLINSSTDNWFNVKNTVEFDPGTGVFEVVSEGYLEVDEFTDVGPATYKATSWSDTRFASIAVPPGGSVTARSRITSEVLQGTPAGALGISTIFSFLGVSTV